MAHRHPLRRAAQRDVRDAGHAAGTAWPDRPPSGATPDRGGDSPRFGPSTDDALRWTSVARQDTTPARSDLPSPDGPVRTCVGCRQRAARRELLRLVVGTHDGRPAVVPDPTGSAAGRGAHLHPTTACYELAVRRKAFARALRAAGGQGLPTDAVATYLTRVPDSRDRTPGPDA
ncbi:YlxR family protein [Nocardioides sp.]|uniref:YlxR family protein n=1 Tax=Nocardioides sp. TaxID=35761 RepID=UPI00351462B9